MIEFDHYQTSAVDTVAPNGSSNQQLSAAPSIRAVAAPRLGPCIPHRGTLDHCS